jgi:protein-tyrosine phosphatase
MNVLEPGQNIEVPDPYWNNDGFEQVYTMLDKACDSLIERHQD